MRRLALLTLLALPACVSGRAPASGDRAMPAGDGAELFAPGVVSTAQPEFATSLSPSGDRVFFNRASADRSRLVMHEARRSDGHWIDVGPLPFSGSAADVDPFMAPDGSRLYFSSNRPAGPGDTMPDFDTWVVPVRGDGWGEPRRLPEPVNSPASDIFVSVDRAGTLYFSSDRDGARSIYAARRAAGGRAAPIRVPFEPNHRARLGNPAISPDGRILVFTWEGDAATPGHGAVDLWVTCRLEDGWTPGRNLGPAVNSRWADFAPAFTPDGEWLHFTSERPGLVPERTDGSRPPGDLYRIRAGVPERACRP